MPILRASEHDLDAAARLVAALIVSDRLVAGFSTRHAGLDALALKGVSAPIRVAVARRHCALGRSSSSAAAPV